MTAARVDTWIWALIYIGMVLIALGLSVQRSSAAMGWTIAVTGAVLTVVGAVLIFVRSKMKSD